MVVRMFRLDPENRSITGFNEFSALDEIGNIKVSATLDISIYEVADTLKPTFIFSILRKTMSTSESVSKLNI
jgi:hypothetical protein